MRRRDFVKAGALLAGVSRVMPTRMWADVPDHLWEGYQFGSPQVTNRLDQGPFGIDQDEGWFTIFATQPSRDHIRNFGAGLVGYTWEENGPALGVQCGRETLEQSVEKMASLPFVDVSVHPLRLARCADRARQVELVPGLGHHIRRCQAPQSGRGIPNPAFQSKYPTAKAFDAGFST